MNRAYKLYGLKQSILVLLFFTTTWKAAAQQPMRLQDCISYSLEHNIDVQLQTTSYQIAEEQYRQSKRNFMPTVSAASNASMYYGKFVDPTTNDFVNQRLFSSRFNVGAQISLFQGFMKHHNKAFNYHNMALSMAEKEKAERSLKFNTMQAYYELMYSKALVQICEQQQQLSKAQLHKMQKLLDLGLKSEADLLDMQAQLADETYRVVSAQGQLTNAQLQLRHIMNYTGSVPLEIEMDRASLSVAAMSASADSLFEMALINVPEIRAAHHKVLAAHKYLAMQRAALYPSLSLGASYASNFADSQKEKRYPNDPENTEVRTIPFGKQIDHNASQNIYLSLSIPILDRWSRRSAIKVAKCRLHEAELQQKQGENNLYQSIMTDVEQMKAYNQQIRQLQIKANAAKKALQATKKQWEHGLKSIIEYTTAKNSLAQTQTDLLRVQTQRQVLQYTIQLYCE